MIESFKVNLIKTIQKLIERKVQLLVLEENKKIQQIKTDLQKLSDPKSIQLLFMVLENDFNLDNDNIATFFDKLDIIHQQLNKQTAQVEKKIPQTIPIQQPSQNQFLQKELSDRRVKNQKYRRPPKLIKHNQSKYYTQTTEKNSNRNRNSTNYDFTEEEYQAKDREIDLQLNQNNQENIFYSNQIFNLYHKLPLGILKDNSFQDRSLSYKTLNYQKILCFLEEFKIKASAEEKLGILKILKKNCNNIRYVSKEDFVKVFLEIRKLLKIQSKVLSIFIDTKKLNIKIFSNKKRQRQPISLIDNKSFLKKSQQIDKQSYTEKKPTRHRLVQRLNEQKSYFQSANKLKDNNKLYIQNAKQKFKNKTLNWQKIYHMTEPSVFQNITIPNLNLNQDNKQQDNYYLQDFVNLKSQKNTEIISPQKYEKYGKLNKMKIILPTIKMVRPINKTKISDNR